MAIVLNGTSGAQIPLGTAAAPSATNTTAQATGLYFPSSTTLGLSTNGTAALTIDASQNVGIGTTLPAYPLSISKTTVGGTVWANVNNTDTTSGSAAGYFASNGSVNAVMYSSSFAGTGTYGMTTNHPAVFITNNSERMRIDSSGNVGIGTSSPGSKLDVVRSDSEIVTQAICSNANKYSFVRTYNSNQASNTIDYGVNNDGSGLIIVRAAPTSGTKAFTLNYGPVGDLLAFDTNRIATFSNSVQIGQNFTTGINTSTGDCAIEVGGSRTGSGNSYIDFHSTSGTDYEARIIRGSGANGGLTISNTGTGGFSIQNDGAAQIGFNINGAERMRIDSSGNLLVGTTSYVYPLSVVKTATNNRVAYLRADTSSYTDSILILDTPTAAGTSCRFIEGYAGSATLQFRVFNNGNVQNANNSYGSTSDAKLKENVVDATPKLDNLMQVKVRNYNLIGDTNKQIGVIAQELEQVFPGMVYESPDFDIDGNDLGTTTKSVKYSVFVPMLIKAIQELSAKVDAQAAEIAVLKGTK